MKEKTQMCVLVCCVVLFCVVGPQFPSRLQAEEAIDIGGRLELMVDDYLIESMDGAKRQLHHPTPREVSLVLDEPWEANGCAYATVFRDGDRCRMYYVGAAMQSIPEEKDKQFGIEDVIICYAESPDGIHWEKPNLGLMEFKGSKKNNIVWRGKGSHGFAVFKDSNPDCDPGARYKALGTSHLGGGYLFSLKSTDGLHWSLMEGLQKHGALFTPKVGDFDSQNLAFWDSHRKEYRLYFRARRKIKSQQDLQWYRGHNGGGDRGYYWQDQVRDIKTATSLDFRHWTEPQFLQYPQAPVEELYTNQIIPYYRAPHILLGFPGRLVIVQRRGTIPPPLYIPPLTQWAKHRYTDGLLMSSRNGRSFHRWEEAFIRPGMPEEDYWVKHDNFQNWGIVETTSDLGVPQLSFYIYEGPQDAWLGRSKPIERSITRYRRHTLRIDGFVSLNAPLDGGECVTRPIVFEGDELALNFSTSAAGSVRVEIQDGNGRPANGFRLDECPRILGNKIEHIVEWKNGSDVSKLAGRPIRLRFELRDSHLYSFRFRK